MTAYIHIAEIQHLIKFKDKPDQCFEGDTSVKQQSGPRTASGGGKERERDLFRLLLSIIFTKKHLKN